MRRSLLRYVLGGICFIFLAGSSGIGWAAKPFPEYDCIAPNVAFWKKVYSHYTTSQGIVHDSEKLNVIYDVIALAPYDAPGSGEINRNRMKAAKDKYAAILNRLANNPKPMDNESTRVARLFGTKAGSKTYRLAAERIRCQVGQKDRFMSGVIRSGAYMREIRTILRAEGLPEDLAYLPHVESSFNTHAYSKVGAAGMWQFMPATGKRFMRVDYAVDERLDPIIATRAAARLLKENYASLGCWALALTAYNHGTGGMARAKALHGNYPSIYKHYQSKTFKFASRNFYAEFLAAREIAADYQTYFGKLELDRPMPTRTVPVKQYLALGDASRHYGVDSSRIKALNPALRPPVISGRKLIPKGYTLRLPGTGKADSQPPPAEIPADLYKPEQNPSHFYTVRAGDTASKIARLHGIKLETLMAANDLNRRSVLYPRQALRIPASGEKAGSKPEKTIEKQRPVTTIAAATPNERAKDELPHPPPELTEYPKPILASVLPLHMDNRVENGKAAAAETVTGAYDRPNLELVTADMRVKKMTRVGGRPVAVVHVEVEENLGRFAEWAQTSIGQIRKLNHLGKNRVLQLGQKLKIPLSNTTVTAFEEQRYEYHKQLQEDFFAAYRIVGLQPHQVRRGETHWTLCNETFSIPLWLLKHCNPEVDLTALSIDQRLMIPSIDRIGANEPGTGGRVEEEDETEPSAS